MIRSWCEKPFVQIPERVLLDTSLVPSAVRVFAALAKHADKAGLCWPSVALLGKETGLKKRSVQNQLRCLEEAGYLSRSARYRQDGSRSTDRFQLMPNDGATTCVTEVQLDAPAPCEEVHDTNHTHWNQNQENHTLA